MNDEKMISVKEAASFLGVHPETVRRWVRDGVLPSAQLVPRGAIRLCRGHLVAQHRDVGEARRDDRA